MKLIIVIFLVLLVSCAGTTNLTKNTTQKGKFLLRNGVYADKEWQEDLTFDRYTWHHEMTMYYDVLIARMAPTSSFNFWFSEDELKEANSCADFRIALLYTMDSAKISHSRFFEQLEKANFKRVEILNFRKNLQMHPDATANSFGLYQVYGLCKKGKDALSATVNFPSFREVNID